MLTKSIQAMFLSCTVLMANHAAQAQDFPSKPIKMLVGFSAGGGTDALARLYAKELESILGTPVIVENKPGASQLMALNPLLTAKADGYTLAFAAGSALVLGPGVRHNLPYDPIKDFSHIAMVAKAPGIISVKPQSPLNTIEQLIQFARDHPGKLNYGSAGVGASNHLQTEYMMNAVKISMTHIPYKSDQEVVMQIAGGDLDVGLTVAQPAVQMALAGKIKPIAVTGSTRLPDLPNVPSLAEAGIKVLANMDSYTFYGLVGPANIPKDIVDKINHAANKVSQTPAVVATMRKTMYFEPISITADEFSQYMSSELPKWKKLGAELNLNLD